MQSLDGGSERGTLGTLHRDDGITEDIGEDLAPGRALASATGETNFRGLEAEAFHAAQAVGHAEGDALHRGARHVGGREIRGGHAVQNSATVREVRGALALQVGQKEETVGAWWDAGNLGIHAGVIPAKEGAERLGGHGDIHRAEQRHPMVGTVAESGDLTLRVDDRLVATGENRAAGSEAGGDDSRLCVSRADGRHHVVPSPGADDDLRRKAPLLGQGGEERSNGFQ